MVAQGVVVLPARRQDHIGVAVVVDRMEVKQKDAVVVATGLAELRWPDVAVAAAIVDVVHGRLPLVDVSLPPSVLHPHADAALLRIVASANYPVVASIAPVVVVAALQLVDAARPPVAPQHVVDVLLRHDVIFLLQVASFPLLHVFVFRWLPFVVGRTHAELRQRPYFVPHLPPTYDDERLLPVVADDRWYHAVDVVLPFLLLLM